MNKKIKSALLFFFVLIAILLLLMSLNSFIYKHPNFISMLESFVQNHGLKAGFLISFIGSLWFVTFPYEIPLSPFLKFYIPHFIPIITFAVASSFADALNFLTGKKLGKSVAERKIKKETLKKIQNFLNKYGLYTLFLFSLIGFASSYDIVVFVVGSFSNIKFKKLMLATFLCRIIYFSVVLVIANLLIKLAGLPI